MICQTVTLNSNGSKTFLSKHGDYRLKVECNTTTTYNGDGSRTRVTKCETKKVKYETQGIHLINNINGNKTNK